MSVKEKIKKSLLLFTIYGILLTTGEIAFYNLTRVGRLLPDSLNWLFAYQWRVDPSLQLDRVWNAPVASLYGQASLWMFFVYAIIIFFGLAPASRLLKNQFIVLRAAVYMFLILSMECALGWLLYWGTGLHIWYYTGPYAILRYTTLAIAPLWFLLGFSVDYLVPRIELGVDAYFDRLAALNKTKSNTAPGNMGTSNDRAFSSQKPLVKGA